MLQGLLVHFILYAVDPGFYSTNWLFLGKTHLKLGEKAKAKEWLQKTVNFDGSFAGDEEDVQVNVACIIGKSISVSSGMQLKQCFKFTEAHSVEVEVNVLAEVVWSVVNQWVPTATFSVAALTDCIPSEPITYAQAKAEAKKLLSGL